MTNLPESIWADEGDDRVEYVRADVVAARIAAESEPQWQDGYNSARDDLDAESAHISAREAKLAEIDAHRRKVIAENERQMNALIESSRRIAALEAQLAERVKTEREIEYDVYSKIRLAFRRALSELPEIAPLEVSRVLSSVHMRDEFINEGKRLQQAHGTDAVTPRVEQECGAGAWSFMRKGILSALEATPPAPKVTEAQAEVVAKLITKWLGRSWEGLPEGRVIEKGFPVFSHSQRGWGFNGRKGDMIDLAHEALTAAQEAGKP